MTNFPILSGVFRSNLLALQKTQKLIDQTTLRLATGLKVNSALDNPQNFFTAKALNYRAADLSRRLDGIGQSIRTIEEGVNGVEAIEKFLKLGETRVLEELRRFREEGPLPPPSPVVTTVAPPPLDGVILADAPDAYWRLDDAPGAAVNAGAIGAAVNGTYINGPTLGAPPLYTGGANSVEFNGVNQGVDIPDHALINLNSTPNRTVELVFNANSTAGRQVLYEEGAAVNSFTIYIDNGRLYVTGRDQGAWGPANISVPINVGETYHVAFTFDSVAGEFIGYVNGVNIGQEVVTAPFPSHSGDIGIGYMNENAWFHDGAQTGTGLYFDGRISDVALYNATLTQADMTARATSASGGITGSVVPSTPLPALSDILDQITQVTVDASYRGINLLGGEDLITLFNEDGSSRLLTEGVDFSAEGLGIQSIGFETEAGILTVLNNIREAIGKVRRFGTTLAVDMGVLATRERFTQNTINMLKAGADDLTVADQNEEGANLLALQTRQALGITSLSIAATASQGVLGMFV